MKLFECQNCGQPLYFENTRCESCGLRLGYVPDARDRHRVAQDAGLWTRWPRRAGAIFLRQLRQHGVCNWLVPAESADQFCAACRHNRMIPDLTQSDTSTIGACWSSPSTACSTRS